MFSCVHKDTPKDLASHFNITINVSGMGRSKSTKLRILNSFCFAGFSLHLGALSFFKNLKFVSSHVSLILICADLNPPYSGIISFSLPEAPSHVDFKGCQLQPTTQHLQPTAIDNYQPEIQDKNKNNPDLYEQILIYTEKYRRLWWKSLKLMLLR